MFKASFSRFGLWCFVTISFFLLSTVSLGQSDDLRTRAKGFVGSNESRIHDESADRKKLILLVNLASAALAAGDLRKAEKFAVQLQSVAQQIKEKSHWDDPSPTYADHVSNTVLGLVAVDRGDLISAKKHLLLSGNLDGRVYPSLASFGPNMLLAKKLFEKGERESVIQYLGYCAKFWRLDEGRLEQWTKDVSEGRTPEFGNSERTSINNWQHAVN